MLAAATIGASRQRLARIDAAVAAAETEAT
jgi:hypothetical protein